MEVGRRRRWLGRLSGWLGRSSSPFVCIGHCLRDNVQQHAVLDVQVLSRYVFNLVRRYLQIVVELGIKQSRITVVESVFSNPLRAIHG